MRQMIEQSNWMFADVDAYLDGFSEYYFLKDVFTALGLPELQNSAYPTCGVASLNGACSSQGTFHLYSIYAGTPGSKGPCKASITPQTGTNREQRFYREYPRNIPSQR